MKVWIARLSALLCVFFAAGAFAQNTYTAYIDADGRTNTGCTVTLPGGTFTGADFRLQATVTTGSSPQVTNVTLAQCVNGSFGAGTHVGGGYPVGLNVGVGGADAIEFSSSAAGMFGPGTNAAVLGFTAESATGSDVLFTTNGTNTGSPILFAITLPIPALGAGALALLALLVAVIARRKGYGRLYGRMLALSFFALCGMALAATFASDGNVNDWNGIPPVATDPTGDPTNGSPDIDLVAAFAAYQNNTIYFRVDVKDVQTQAPTITSANSTQFIVGEAGTFSVASTGVPSPALTLTGCTLPANLTFVDNGNGTGTLAGTPAAGTAGTYNCTITASNGIPPDATQPFTLTVANAPSTTTLGANPPSPSVFGQSVTFTATVTATPPAVGTPTGTVTFLDNGSSIGTGTLSGGVATLTTGALAVGSTHSITAQYGGDSNFGTSTSSALPYTVNQDGTTTALNANPNPSMFNQNVTFTATVTATAPGAGTPTGTVTFKDGSTTLGPGTLTGGVATFSTSTLSVGPHTITAQYGGDVDFTGSTSTTVNQTVNQANQTITFTSTAPAAATVGGPTYTATATATSGLAVSLTIDATATSVCSISGSTVSFIGAGTCVIDANQAGNGNYTAAPQVQQSFVVGKGSQTISFTSTAPAAATVAGPTYTVTATATSGLAVAFTIDATATSVCSISGSTVSFIGAGTCVIDANQAGNANYNAAPQVQQSFTVGKGSQTISFTSTAPVGAAVAGPTYTVTATATSGLAVTFTIDATATSVCSISGSTVSFIGAGTCVIDANQAGNANYNAAPQVQQSFAVAKGSQTISFTSTAPVGASVGGPTYTATATATSGLAVTLTIDATATSVCSISGSTVSFIGAGTCVIDANQPGNANYTAAPQVQQSFAVAKGSQTISFTSTAPVGATVGGATYTATATASPSGLPVTLTIDATATSVCSISGSTVSFIGAGTCVIDANQAGNANYNAAPQAQQSFAVGKGNQTISFTSTAPAGAVVGGPTYTVTATATSGLAVAFTIDATATSVCSISGSTVSFIGAGTCVIDANQAGNANYNAAPQVQQSFAVSKNNQTISFTSTAPVGATVGGPTYTVTATASPSGLPVTFTIDATATSVCSIAGSTVSFIGAGTCVIDANQAGNANYNAAPQVQQSFAVGKGSQTISFTSTAPVGASVGGPTYTVTATATSGLAVTFTIDATATSVCSISGSAVSFIGAGTCVIDANQAGNANYNPAPQAQQSFAVAKGSQTISFTSTAPSGATFGGATYTVTATATSGLAVTFTIDATATSVCSISGSTVSFIGVGTCVIDANQAGNANYNPAPQVQQSFAVAKADQTISFTSTAPSNALVAGPTYTVTATATSGLAVTFTIDATATSVCSISGSTVSFIGGGTCVIDANQAGNANYNAAPQVQQSFIVNKNNQTISFTSTAPANAKNAGPTYTVAATATSGLAVTFTIDATATSVCSISGSTVSFIGAGTCVIDANQPGNAAYNPAPQVQQSFLVAKGDQTISFTSVLAAFSATSTTYTVTATASPSGLAVTFSIDASSTGGCTITGGNTVHFNTPGTCVIDANQAGDSNWNAAPQVQQATTMEDPAVAGADSHAVTGNVAISVPANGVLSNDTGTVIAIKSYGASTGSEQSTLGSATPTAQGGSVALNADGSYTFTPKANFNGTDTFKYIIANDVSSATGTVTLTVTDRIMVVSTGGGGSCIPASPCTLAVADAAASVSPAIDLVFVESGTYGSATFSLNNNQKIVGNFVSLNQAISDAGITLATDSVAPTNITASTTPVLNNAGNVLVLGGNNLIEYFAINPSAGAGISGGAAVTGTTTAKSLAIGSSGTANAIALTSQAATHTFNLDSASSITHSSSAAAVSLTGAAGQGPVTIAAPISSTSGSPVTVSGRTGGTVSFSGTVSGTGQGVSLTGNSGSTINFSGQLTLSTGANDAFTATGGGTVSTSNTNSTITTTTGTAINVANTTIGAANLEFKSVSAGTAASGPANGIVLNNTGTSGGLVIAGTGSAGSGGTIQKGTVGINLTSTKNVSLSWMNVSANSQEGVLGSGVNGFALQNSSVINNSTAANNRDGVKLTDTVGAVSFVNDTATGNYNFNVQLTTTPSSTAVISSLTVTGGSYSSSVQNGGFLVDLHGSAVLQTALVSGATFNNNFSKGIQFQQNDSTVMGNGVGAPGTGTITVDSCSFTSDDVAASFEGGGGSANGGAVYYRFTNNATIMFSHSVAVNFANGSTGGTGTFKAFVNNNHIGQAGVAVSGSDIGEGMRFFMQGQQSATLTITNNVIRGLDNNSSGPDSFDARGIDVEELGSSNNGVGQTSAQITITNNDIDQQYTGSSFNNQYAIYVASDAQANSGSNVLAEIHDNKVPTQSACDSSPCAGNDSMVWFETVSGASGPETAALYNKFGDASVNAALVNRNTGPTAGWVATQGTVTLTATPPATVN